MITVVTPTVGNSARRLDVLLRELRAYTALPFQQIVVDDATPDPNVVLAQEEVCQKYGAIHVKNDGVSGLADNLNFAFERVTTPWAYVVEDGVRPSRGWLEAATSLILQVGDRQFDGMEVGMAGFAHVEDYFLAMGGAIPGADVMAYIQRTKESRAEFYGDWNDGWWCWRRLLPAIRAYDGPLTEAHLKGLDHDRLGDRYREGDWWPSKRHPVVAFAPGGLILVNLEKWKSVGRFRTGCSYYEGHLGLRMARAGIISLYVQAPPWLHSPSQGFSDPLAQARKGANNLHTHEIFQQDFGGTDVKEILSRSPVEISRVNEAMRSIRVDASGWDTRVMGGYEDMPKVVANAPGDIRHHLWSLYWIARLLNARHIVELGVREGDSTRAFLSAAKDLGARVISYDIQGDAYNVRNVTSGFGIPWVDGLWECRKGDSVEAGRTWAEGEVDLVFVDTSHTFDGTLAELREWAPRVRDGGAIVLHDTGNQDPTQNGVRPAIDQFLKDAKGWVLEDHPQIAEGDVGLGILWKKSLI